MTSRNRAARRTSNRRQDPASTAELQRVFAELGCPDPRLVGSALFGEHLEGDAASDDDRAWFLAHPGATERLRRYRPGELGPLLIPSSCEWVLVRQIRPGLRVRAALDGAPVGAGGEA